MNKHTFIVIFDEVAWPGQQSALCCLTWSAECSMMLIRAIYYRIQFSALSFKFKALLFGNILNNV